MQKLYQILLPMALVGIMTLSASAVDVHLTLQPEQELNRIDEKIYSHFLEHIYHSINGGLWGELVLNRSFEDTIGGGWTQEEDIITQKSRSEDQRLTFGNTSWADYEFTVEARKTGGAEGFLVLFRVQSDKVFSWANLGGWNNRQHAVERRSAEQGRQSVVGRQVNGRIAAGKWYTIKVRCEGDNVKVFLDGQQVLDVNDSEMASDGNFGIGTWNTQAQFRNFKVTTLDGQTIHDEVPEIFNAVQMRHWENVPFGESTVMLDSENVFNGKHSSKFVVRDLRTPGLRQSGFELKTGETYLVSYWVKRSADSSPGVRLYFYDSQRSLIPHTQRIVEPITENGGWLNVRMEINGLSRDESNATLVLLVDTNEGSHYIDQVSLMPKSWAENGGFRPDLLQAIADLRPPVIRYPGGCFASAYRWKDGIGPQEKRQPYPFSIWDDLEVNSYGTDEFIKMCRLVGAEPMIVVNTGTPGWNVRRTPDTADVDWVQEACDWLEYCNGPATSKWGKVRAENGHPAPYNVKYWEIDNEVQGEIPAAQYIASIKKFVPAMKKIDPTIKIAVAGSHYGPRGAWDFPVINESGELFDYISFHQYDDPKLFADGPGRIENYFHELKAVIDKSPNKHIKIFDSEWNAQSTDWRTGLYAGGILNVFERCGDFVEMAAPALFLRHTRARDWDNAFINFDNRSWFPAPNYVVMKLWREHYAPIRIGLDGDVKGMNVVATKSADGKTVYFKAVNPTNEVRNVTLNVGGGKTSASLKLVTANGLNDRNTLENPKAIVPRDAEVGLDGGVVRFELPAYSAGVVAVE